MPRHNILGQRFGRLVALRRAPDNKWNQSQWFCICDCGIAKTISANHLRTVRTTSCGCKRKENLTGLTHGKSDTPEYKIWCGMLNRCRNQKVESYKYYGAKGITVCE